MVDKRLPLSHLICLFLVFRLRCCNGFSSSQQASCVMAPPSPPRFFAAWRVEALFLFPASMGSTLRGLCDARFYSAWIIILCQGRFSRRLWSSMRSSILLWLRCSPTILAQETPSVKNVDPTCSTTSLFWRCNMPSSRTHVLGLACKPVWQILFFRTIDSS